VAEHHDVDGQFLSFTPAEPEQLEQTDERQIEKGKGHGPVFVAGLMATKVQMSGLG